jgi:hypothetical protein
MFLQQQFASVKAIFMKDATSQNNLVVNFVERPTSGKQGDI